MGKPKVKMPWTKLLIGFSMILGFFSGAIFNYDDSASKVIIELSTLGDKKRSIVKLRQTNKRLYSENIRLRQIVESENANLSITDTTIRAIGVSNNTIIITCENGSLGESPLLVIENTLKSDDKVLLSSLLTSLATSDDLSIFVNRYTDEVYGVGDENNDVPRLSCSEIRTAENFQDYIISGQFIGPIRASRVREKNLKTIHSLHFTDSTEKERELIMDKRAANYKLLVGLLLTASVVDYQLYFQYDNKVGIDTVRGIIIEH